VIAPPRRWAQRRERARLALTVAVLLGAAPPDAAAQPERAYSEERDACASHSPTRRPFFGDLHVHTVLSLDASTQGTKTRPDDAYRFAKGERIGIQPFTPDGRPMRHIRLARPLDFAAVTDHAELLGEVNICSNPGLDGHDSLMCKIYRNWPRVAFFWMNFQASRATRHDFCGEGGHLCEAAARAPWNEVLEAADRHYDRSEACSFTTLPAYEWTGGAGLGRNFHRNVIFRNANVPDRPVSFVDHPDLYDFWRALETGCIDAGTGCDVLVIPHNSNLSGGMMFETVQRNGEPITREQAEQRAKFERLAEVMQHKGDSECHPAFSAEDELCGFEKLAMNGFAGRYFSPLAEPPVERQFLRTILALGLAEEARLGTNPFHFGLIASTDTHLGAPGLEAESADYPGPGGAGTPAGSELPPGLPDAFDFNPGGLAVLWAEENSRDALFDAMHRREAYGTSGPRIVVRFFGGFDLPPDLCSSMDLGTDGYAHGVPMGADLGPRSDDGPPRFAVSALRDPGTASTPGTPLQRIQIIKGWVDGGSTHERVYEVSGDANNGAGVAPNTCEPFGPGADALCGVFEDPDFDPAKRAFYYARVVENPTCRWTQKACLARGVRCEDPATVTEGLEGCCAPDHRKVIQERAWTSPIWYTPQGAEAGS
jgi:hypothetical protein